MDGPHLARFVDKRALPIPRPPTIVAGRQSEYTLGSPQDLGGARHHRAEILRGASAEGTILAD
jgi:hypothetical protein